VRSKTDKLMVVQGGIRGDSAGAAYGFGGSSAHGGYVQGATALRGEFAEAPNRSEEDDFVRLEFSPPESGATSSIQGKRAEARMKGYVGEACPECGNFTMVRNGTCLKCETCGGTTGCS
jgi:ribonucleoside-diphosphate reductase alpha chain